MKFLSNWFLIFIILSFFVAQVQSSNITKFEDLEQINKNLKKLNIHQVIDNNYYNKLKNLDINIWFEHILPYCDDKIILVNAYFFETVTGYSRDNIKDTGFDSYPINPVCNIMRTKIIDHSKLVSSFNKDIEKIPSFIWYSLAKEVKNLSVQYWSYLTKSCIDTVDLSGNEIGWEELKKFPSSLKIKSLDLSNNNIDDLGAEILAKTLDQNTYLIFLNLYNNFISDVGAKALSEKLTVIVLDLEDNNITDIGLKYLNQNESFQIIYSENNNISNNDYDYDYDYDYESDISEEENY